MIEYAISVQFMSHELNVAEIATGNQRLLQHLAVPVADPAGGCWIQLSHQGAASVHFQICWGKKNPNQFRALTLSVPQLLVWIFPTIACDFIFNNSFIFKLFYDLACVRMCTRQNTCVEIHGASSYYF